MAPVQVQWRKAIPEKRDRLQSKVLVAVMVPVLAYYLFQGLTIGLRISGRCFQGILVILALSITLSVIVWLMRAGTAPAAVVGGMICFLITSGTASCLDWAVRSGCAPLMATLILTLAATKAGKAIKLKNGLAENSRGRNVAQVIANLSIASLYFPFMFLAVRYSGRSQGHIYFVIVPAMMFAALAEAAADTVSSEIGQAFGGKPILITTFRRVEPGTDGAISIVGTIAGLAAAATVVAAGIWSMQKVDPPKQFSSPNLANTIFAASVVGFLFDTFLGATAERRGWLGNDIVNFSSTAVAALAAMAMLTWLR